MLRISEFREGGSSQETRAITREAPPAQATNRDGNAGGYFGHRRNQRSKARRLIQGASFSVR